MSQGFAATIVVCCVVGGLPNRSTGGVVTVTLCSDRGCVLCFVWSHLTAAKLGWCLLSNGMTDTWCSVFSGFGGACDGCSAVVIRIAV